MVHVIEIVITNNDMIIKNTQGERETQANPLIISLVLVLQSYNQTTKTTTTNKTKTKRK